MYNLASQPITYWLMFSAKDLKQIKKRSINIKDIEKQIENFKSGFPFLDIVDSANYKFGINKLEQESEEKYIEYYDQNLDDKKILKFVPASGAATRMFKSLFEMMNTYKGTEREYLRLLVDRSFNSLFYTYDNMDKFPFYDDLKEEFMKDNLTIDNCLEKHDYVCLLKKLLTEEGLDYGNMPKGLIKFHKYSFGSRTSVHEHMVEGALYAKTKGKVYLHFTVSPEHKKMFKDHFSKTKAAFEKKYEAKYYIGFSEQRSFTDTIAVDMNNEPLRNADGDLVFRPGGHGALIYNLDKINADLVFIKNIDNVVPDYFKKDTIRYKKVLAGKTLELQSIIFDYIKQLKKSKKVTEKLIKEITKFFKVELLLKFPESFEKLEKDEKVKFLINRLNRPLRVCGMVRNEGEPGGGPYLVKGNDGIISPQIVEGSQFDPNNPDQKKIINESTHFNPVDLVCAVKDYRGRKFNLTKYVDESTGFISIKSKDGIELKAQELPGLWNGAMAHWNTAFIEVPITTFNPVKVMNDLLRKEHQAIS
jgi:Domain of unknown function (DUF4301)